jgi:hypothetical protein
LIPAVGALIFTVDGFDQEVSDWATKHTPIFGSQKAAKDGSNYLRNAIGAGALVTALATPSGDDTRTWTRAKLKGIGVQIAAWGATKGATGLLKSATDRTRPDDSDDNSFPSGHSSDAFAFATLANRNLNYIELADESRLPLQVGNLLLATGCAWARVEGGKHYPSDVLAGAALGYFFSALIHDAFMGLPESEKFNFVILPYREGAMVELSFRY